VENILAFSSLKKTQELGQRINREITRVRTTKDLFKKVGIDEEDTIILVDLATLSMEPDKYPRHGKTCWKNSNCPS